MTMLIFFPSLAQAETLFVDAHAPGGDGTSWSAAFADLQDALTAAASDPSIDAIWVAEGEYRPTKEFDAGDPRSVTFQMVPGVSVLGGFSGSETSAAEADPSAFPTVLSCDLSGDDEAVVDAVADLHDSPVNKSDNCYHVALGAGGPETEYSGLVFERGYADVGLYTDHTTWGGGMWIGEEASPTIDNCVFRENYAWAEGGGLLVRREVTVVRSLFERNVGGDGGGVMNGYHGVAPVQGGYFGDNLFVDNGAWIEGAALHAAFATVTIEHAVALYNDSNNGGAFTLGGQASHLLSSVIAFNQAEHQGGGVNVFNFSYGPPTIIDGCTIVGNTAYQGGAVYSQGPNELRNSIVWGNTSGFSKDVRASGFDAVVVNSLVEDLSVAPGPIDPSVFDGQPDFVDYEGGDFSLLPTSICIDAGDTAASLGASDVDGQPRVMGACEATVDVGAHEAYYPACWNEEAQCQGDSNGDGVVNALELSALLNGFNSQYGDAHYDPCADFNHDGTINFGDVAVVSGNYLNSPTGCVCGDAFPP